MRQAQISASTSSLASYSLADATETVRRLGFKSVGLLAAADSRNALGVLPGFSWHYLDVNGMNAAREATRGFEIVSIHAPYEDLPLVSSSPDVRTLAQIVIQKSSEAVPYLGGSSLTFHLEPPQHASAADAWEGMLAAAREVAKYAKIFSLKVGVENSPRLDAATFLRLIGEIAAPNLGATLDLGVAARVALADLPDGPEAAQRANAAIVEMIRALGDRLYHVHAHDVRAVANGWSDHRELGTGILDWARIVAALDEAGYDGALEIELEEENREEALWNSRLLLESFVDESASQHGAWPNEVDSISPPRHKGQDD